MKVPDAPAFPSVIQALVLTHASTRPLGVNPEPVKVTDPPWVTERGDTEIVGFTIGLELTVIGTEFEVFPVETSMADAD